MCVCVSLPHSLSPILSNYFDSFESVMMKRTFSLPEWRIDRECLKATQYSPMYKGLLLICHEWMHSCVCVCVRWGGRSSPLPADRSKLNLKTISLDYFCVLAAFLLRLVPSVWREALWAFGAFCPNSLRSVRHNNPKQCYACGNATVQHWISQER